LLKADLHIHTEYSFDTASSLENIIARCQERGINCIAVADHGTIAGGLRMKEIAPFSVIVAEEVLTPFGEVMGMFLTEEVPSQISLEEAVARIKAQDGLVCLPHPFDYLRGIVKKNPKEIEKVLPDIDIVEVFNSRIISKRCNGTAERFARQHGLLRSAGSDAHTLHEIGHAYVEMPEFEGKEEFCASLKAGNIVGRRSCPFVHTFSTLARIKKRLKK